MAFEFDLASVIAPIGDPFEIELKQVTHPAQGMGSKPNSWIFDSNFEAENSEPFDRSDLAIGRTDFDELVDRHGSKGSYNIDVNSTSITAAPKHGPNGPNWCSFHNVNHHHNTKCEHQKSSPQSVSEPKSETGSSGEEDPFKSKIDYQALQQKFGFSPGSTTDYYLKQLQSGFVISPSTSSGLFSTVLKHLLNQGTVQKNPDGSYQLSKVQAPSEPKKSLTKDNLNGVLKKYDLPKNSVTEYHLKELLGGTKDTISADDVYNFPIKQEQALDDLVGLGFLKKIQTPTGTAYALAEQPSSPEKKEVPAPLEDTGVVKKNPDGSYQLSKVQAPETKVQAPSEPKKGKNWCEHHKVNHNASTKCPYLEAQNQKKAPNLKTPTKENFNAADLASAFHHLKLEAGSPESKALKEIQKSGWEGLAPNDLGVGNDFLTKATNEGFLTYNPDTHKYVFGQFGTQPPKYDRDGKLVVEKPSAPTEKTDTLKKIDADALKKEFNLPLDTHLVIQHFEKDPGYIFKPGENSKVNEQIQKLVSAGHLQNLPNGNVALPGPHPLTKGDSAEAAKDLGWNIGGKGESFIRTIGKSGEDGLTLQEGIDQMPKSLAGTKKPDLGLAKSLIEQAIAKGWAFKKPGSDKYVFGFYGPKPISKNSVPAIKTPMAEPEPAFSVPAPPEKVTFKSETAYELPKPKYASKPAPVGTTVQAYDAAFGLGFDLHDPDQAKEFQTKGFDHVITKLGNGGALTGSALGASKETLQELVNQGGISTLTPQALFGAGDDWKQGHFQIVNKPKPATTPSFLPQASQMTWSATDSDKPKCTIKVNPKVVDSLDAWGDKAPRKVLELMSTNPGRVWALEELKTYGAKPTPQQEKFFRFDKDTVSAKWDVIMSATSSAGTKCKNCDVVHREDTVCPYENISSSTYVTLPEKPEGPGFKAQTKLIAEGFKAGGAAAPYSSLTKASKELGIGLGGNTVGSNVLKTLQTEQNFATLIAACKTAGFSSPGYGKIQKLLEDGVAKDLIVKTPTGGYILKGGGFGPPQLPEPGESILVPELSSQPAPDASEIRIKYPSDHPIQGMSEAHAKRYHELYEWYSRACDPIASPGFVGKKPGDLKMEDVLRAGTKAMGNYTSLVAYELASEWKVSSSSFGGVVFGETLQQMGVNKAPLSKARPKFVTSDTGDGGFGALFGAQTDYQCHTDSLMSFSCHKTDLDAPTFISIEKNGKSIEAIAKYFGVGADDVKSTGSSKKVWIKGPSRSEILLNQMAMTHAAMKAVGRTSQDLYRGIQDKGYTGKGIVSDMMNEAEESKANGQGAKVLMNPCSSWSSGQSKAKTFAGGSGIVLQKTIPSYLTLMHYDQVVTNEHYSPISKGGNVFGSYTDVERETIAIGHFSTTIGPIGKDGRTVKIADLELSLGDEPVPKGFAKFIGKPDGGWLWENAEGTQVIAWIDHSSQQKTGMIELDMGT